MSSSTAQPAESAPVGGPQPSDGAEAQPTRDEVVRKAYAEATTALREQYRDEFNADVKARVKAAGFEWSPRPTEKEKAKAKLQALLAEHPDLASEVSA